MDMAGICETLYQQPFVPLVIRWADGRSVPVPHPDFVALTPRRAIVGAEDDAWSVIEPRLIVTLDDSSNPRTSNGPAPRRRNQP